jgi:hypothetical protein
MPAYILSLPGNIQNGAKNKDVVVFAEDVANAREFAKSAYSAGNDGAWDLAVVTEIEDPADFELWSIRVRVTGAADLGSTLDVTHVAIASDGVDEVGDALVLLINAHADIANSAMDSLTNILTISSIADNIGEGVVEMTWTPPGAKRQPIISYVGTIVDQGIQGAVLTVQLNTDAVAIGAIIAELPRQE